MLLPLGVNGGNVRISLDELERKVIQGGPHLVDHLAGQNGNLDRRRFGDIQFLFALRFSDEYVRLSFGISGDAFLDRAEVFRCPDEFSFRRFQAMSHSAAMLQRFLS